MAKCDESSTDSRNFGSAPKVPQLHLPASSWKMVLWARVFLSDADVAESGGDAQCEVLLSRVTETVPVTWAESRPAWPEIDFVLNDQRTVGLLCMHHMSAPEDA